jgi:integrase
MLEEYYITDSKYLQDDYANNKRFIPKKNRTEYNGVIKTYFIPYFKENKINSIQEINRNVYTGLKIYLQNVKNKKGEILSTKTINNYLMIINRILQYHERNEIIPKMPYSKGTGILKISKEEKANSKKPSILPIDKLKGIFDAIFVSNNKRENTLLYYTLSLIGLTTGMRDSEIGRIKASDIKYVKGDNYFYIRVYNHKTEYYNTEGNDDYRKIPLHPFVVEVLKLYIKEKNIGKEDYIFGTPKLNEDTKQIDGVLHQGKTHRSICYLYKQIKLKEVIKEAGINNPSEKIEGLANENLKKEMDEKRIVFYSLRHTFNTMCVLYRYKDTDTNRNDDLIDYFMGHNSGSKMRANYTQINKVNSAIFYNNYGKFIINMLDAFLFFSDKKENEAFDNYVDNFINEKWGENKGLLDKEGKMDYEDAIKNIINPLIKTFNSTIADTENTEDIFESE